MSAMAPASSMTRTKIELGKDGPGADYCSLVDVRRLCTSHPRCELSKVAMTDLKVLDATDILQVAALALSKASGEVTVLDDTHLLSAAQRRNLVIRARAVSHSGVMQPVIVKATRSPDYDALSGAAVENFGLGREFAASAYLSTLAPEQRHCARLLAGDAARGVLVFEDVQGGPHADCGSLVEPLLHGSAFAAGHALTKFAEALAHLHADTIGCNNTHHQTARAIFGTTCRRAPRGCPVEKLPMTWWAELVACHPLMNSKPYQCV